MRGFTLVELLVVIGVLGILAVGLLATIDPLEQLRKGRDSNKKTAAIEFVNAVTRYYATNGQMPWRIVTTCTAATGTLGGKSACTNELIAQGELKTTFGEQTSILDKLYMTGTDTTVTVCFDPESKAESKRAETKYTQGGIDDPTNCPATNRTKTDCYWCAQ